MNGQYTQHQHAKEDEDGDPDVGSINLKIRRKQMTSRSE